MYEEACFGEITEAIPMRSHAEHCERRANDLDQNSVTDEATAVSNNSVASAEMFYVNTSAARWLSGEAEQIPWYHDEVLMAVSVAQPSDTYYHEKFKKIYKEIQKLHGEQGTQ